MIFTPSDHKLTKQAGSRLRLSITLGLLGIFLIVIGILAYIFNSFSVGMGSVDGTNIFVLIMLSGLPFIVIGTICMLSIPIILKKKWILYMMVGLILIGLVWIFQALQE